MSTPLQAGDKAPEFTGQDQNGTNVSLQDFKGKKVVLYFYPEDDTPGCTEQACNLRDNYTYMKARGYEVVGVSPDDMEKHRMFKEKYRLPFTLIADPQRQIIDQYGVWGEKQKAGVTYMGLIRTTFVIDENGTITEVINKPNTREHAEEIVK